MASSKYISSKILSVIISIPFRLAAGIFIISGVAGAALMCIAINNMTNNMTINMTILKHISNCLNSVAIVVLAIITAILLTIGESLLWIAPKTVENNR